MSTRLTANQLDLLQVIQHCSHTLRHLIDDMLDIARIEIDKLVLYPTVCRFEDFVQRVVEPFCYLPPRDGVEVKTSLNDMPPYLVFDPSRLQQILNNLIGNSLKFTDDGYVVLELSCREQTQENATVRFTVSDTGKGISEEECQQIFQTFFQGEEGVEPKHGGMGLGLSISRQLVAMMGGVIEVASVPGQGSSFWFDLVLPLAQMCEVSERLESPNSWTARKGRILVAEDNQINQRVISMQLEELGHTVVVVNDGQQALNKISEEETGFDLLILDCQMPVLDGFETARLIRSSRALYAGIPILALTAHAMSDDQMACKLAGMNAFLGKPASMELLGDTIQDLLAVSDFDSTRANH